MKSGFWLCCAWRGEHGDGGLFSENDERQPDGVPDGDECSPDKQPDGNGGGDG